MTGATHLRPAAGWCARRARELADAAVAVFAPAPAGVPPRRLRSRVGAPRVSEYVAGGRAAAEQLQAALGSASGSPGASVLDFGCGSGRVLSHMPARPGDGRRVGIDVDVEAIAWAGEHLEGSEFRPCAARPPLEFAPTSFDLVYSISVFSHLDAEAQDAWLAEIARILAPGGTALLSTHGPTAFEAFRRGEARTAWCDPAAFRRERLGEAEMVAVPYRTDRWSAGDLPGVGEGYGLSFHGPGYIRAHWGGFLGVEAILPRAISGWQDLVVLRG